MTMNEPFTTTTQNLVSYNYTDIQDGTGVISYYGTRLETSTAITWELTTTALSASGYSGDSNVEGDTSGITYNFNSRSLNTPRTLKGNIYVTGTLISDSGNSIYIKVTAQKVSGATVTDVSSQITSNTSSGGTREEMNFAVPLTQTNLAVGDYLRMELVVVGVNSGQYLVADPTETTYNPLRFEVPYLITD